MKSFMAALRSLVLPYGATSGDRIVLDSDDGSIRIYEGTQLVAEMATAAGPDNDAGFIAYSRTGAGYYAMLEDGQLQLGNENYSVDFGGGLVQVGPDVPASLTLSYSGTNPTWTDPSELTLSSGYVGTADSVSAALRLLSGGAAARPRPAAYIEDPTQDAACDLDVSGILTAGSRIVGTTSITPSAANTPTSRTITFPRTLVGTTFACQITANSSVPGTTMLGVGYTAVSATGVTLWLTRSNTTTTTLSYTVEATG